MVNNTQKIKRPFKNLVCLITLWSFLFNAIGANLLVADALAVSPGLPAPNFSVQDMQIPLSFGEIKDRVQGIGDNTIIHIQDAHCNYSAQHSIANIIDHLSDSYKVNLVMLEGGKGNYDLSVFTKIKDPDIRKRVSDYFVKEGRVSGAEFFAINNPAKTKLFGIENENLYMSNLNAYKESLKYKETADKYLSTLTHIINNLKRKIYSPSLTELDETIKTYKEKDLDLKEYVKTLIDKAEISGIEHASFNNITSLAEIIEQEEAINFKTANAERSILIGKLESKLSRLEMERLVKVTIDFKKENITNEDFYGYLFKKARFANVDFKSLPNLVKYSEYVKKYENIDKIKLFKEIKTLEDALMKNLLETDDQKTLFTLDKNLSVMKDMFNVALIKEDYDYYRANKETFKIRHFLEFIDAKSPQYRFNFNVDKNITKLDSFRKNMEKFYAYSIKRDNAFIKNMESKLKKENKNVTILVAGGFHTDNLKNIFKNKGYSYIEVMPRMDVVDTENPYFHLLSGGKSEIETLVETTILNSNITPRHMLSEMGITGSQSDKNLYELSVDVRTALETDAKRGIILMVPGGYLRLTYEKPESEFFEKIGKIEDKQVYAVREENEAYDPNFENAVIVKFDRNKLTYEGHQAVLDLLFKMAHAPNQTYQGLEAHSLTDLLTTGSDLRNTMTGKIGENNVKKLKDICDNKFNESNRFINVITGKDKSPVSWRIGSYSDNYGVNVTYTGNDQEFIRNLFHKLNRAANPGLEHVDNNAGVEKENVASMLTKVEARFPRGDHGTAEMPEGSDLKQMEKRFVEIRSKQGELSARIEHATEDKKIDEVKTFKKEWEELLVKKGVLKPHKSSLIPERNTASRHDFGMAKMPDEISGGTYSEKKGEGVIKEIIGKIKEAAFGYCWEISSIKATRIELKLFKEDEDQHESMGKNISLSISDGWGFKFYIEHKEYCITDESEVLEIVNAIGERTIKYSGTDVDEFLVKFKQVVELTEKYDVAKKNLKNTKSGQVGYEEKSEEHTKAKSKLVNFLEEVMDRGDSFERSISLGTMESEGGYYLDNGHVKVSMPGAYQGYGSMAIDRDLVQWIGEEKIEELLKAILKSGFVPLSFAERFDIKEKGGAQNDLEIFPAFDEKGIINAKAVFVETARFQNGEITKEVKLIEIPEGMIQPGDKPLNDILPSDLQQRLLKEATSNDDFDTAEMPEVPVMTGEVESGIHIEGKLQPLSLDSDNKETEMRKILYDLLEQAFAASAQDLFDGKPAMISLPINSEVSGVSIEEFSQYMGTVQGVRVEAGKKSVEFNVGNITYSVMPSDIDDVKVRDYAQGSSSDHDDFGIIEMPKDDMETVHVDTGSSTPTLVGFKKMDENRFESINSENSSVSIVKREEEKISFSFGDKTEEVSIWDVDLKMETGESLHTGGGMAYGGRGKKKINLMWLFSVSRSGFFEYSSEEKCLKVSGVQSIEHMSDGSVSMIRFNTYSKQFFRFVLRPDGQLTGKDLTNDVKTACSWFKACSKQNLSEGGIDIYEDESSGAITVTCNGSIIVRDAADVKICNGMMLNQNSFKFYLKNPQAKLEEVCIYKSGSISLPSSMQQSSKMPDNDITNRDYAKEKPSQRDFGMIEMPEVPVMTGEVESGIHIEGKLQPLSLDSDNKETEMRKILYDLLEQAFAASAQDLFDGKPAMISLPINSEVSGVSIEEFSQYMGTVQGVRVEAGKKSVEFNVGNITYYIFEDNDVGRNKLLSKLNDKQSEWNVSDNEMAMRSIVYSFAKEIPGITDKAFTVYLEGEIVEGKFRTPTPLARCIAAGIKVFNLFDLTRRDRQGINETDIKLAREDAVRGIISISGLSLSQMKDLADDLIEKVKKVGLFALSGKLFIKIRPVNWNDMIRLHKMEREVLRAV